MKNLTQLILIDDAWEIGALGIPQHLDLRMWSARLRYSVPKKIIESFSRSVVPHLAPFTLYGSGDYHHLTAIWLRQFSEALTLVSFDNHPDWDTRPPRWCCGTWLNRALATGPAERAVVWGCANFELNPPHRWFANHRALRTGQLQIFPWIEKFGKSAQRKFSGFTRLNWPERFASWAATLDGGNVYVTVDLDCLDPAFAATDWEQGSFRSDDLVWALGELRRHSRLIGGDICGAHSPARYDRWTQRRTALLDHPKMMAQDLAHAAELNHRTVAEIWAALTGTLEPMPEVMRPPE